MAGRDIRGISVSIGGDTTKLQSALQGINKERPCHAVTVRQIQASCNCRSGK